MATCIQCRTSKKKKVFLSSQYCDVCGFGFLLDADNTERTCRDPNRVVRGEPSFTKEVPSTPDAAEEPESVVEESQVSIEKPATTTSNLVEKVFEVIKAHPLIGKQDIMKLAQVSDGEYTEAKNTLLQSKRIMQEGEKRGAKYKVMP